MRLTKEQLAALCREYGPRLHVPAGVDGAQTMLSRAVLVDPTARAGQIENRKSLRSRSSKY